MTLAQVDKATAVNEKHRWEFAKIHCTALSLPELRRTSVIFVVQIVALGTPHDPICTDGGLIGRRRGQVRELHCRAGPYDEGTRV